MGFSHGLMINFNGFVNEFFEWVFDGGTPIAGWLLILQWKILMEHG